MANGAPSLIAALCIILIIVTMLPLGPAGLWLRQSRETVMSKIEFRCGHESLS